MDYGFAPGSTTQDGRIRSLFQRRGNTTLIHLRRLSSVRQFIHHLDTTGSVTQPIGDPLIGAHANSEGHVFIPMYPGQRGNTEYEILDATLADATKSIAIPDPLIGHTAGDPITHAVHCKGCNIGKARPYLVKFKEALGDHVNVTAPKHFHGLTPEPAYGVFEYMEYEFIIRRKDAFPSRAAALAAFQGGGFTLIDGSAVPNASWTNWIPTRINRGRATQIPAPLGVTIGSRTTVNTPQQFRIDRYPFTWAITYPNAGAVPGTVSARLAALEANIQAAANFDPSHAYPMFERLGYATFYGGSQSRVRPRASVAGVPY